VAPMAMVVRRMNLRRDNPSTGDELIKFIFFMMWLIKLASRLSCNPGFHNILHSHFPSSFRLDRLARNKSRQWRGLNRTFPGLLEIKNLQLEFGSGDQAVRAVDGVSFSIDAGETLGLVGESGSGKSVTALSIARLLPSPPARYPAGQILLNGQDVLQATKGDLRKLRGGMVSYIFQEPGTSLNPVFRVGRQIKESLKLHRPQAATDAEVVRLLKLVGIPAAESRLRNYPHEMSGGMQQRVMIALALASEPKLLVADEPTTALDVTIQAQILDLLRELKNRLGMSMLLITHNLGIVGQMADRVAVMYAGQIVETARTAELLRRPLHPYTQALIQSVPKLGGGAERLTTIPGHVPNLGSMPPGCRFEPRCAKARSDCAGKAPELVEVEPGRWVRCPYWNAAN
jgi:peptide/nickel transport system ATP-binding protein